MSEPFEAQDKLKLRPPFLCKLLTLRPKPPLRRRTAKNGCATVELLHADHEVSVCDVTVGHARSVEGEAGIAFAIEKDEAAGGLSTRGENTHGLASGERRSIRR
jgi:hypothetical protein